MKIIYCGSKLMAKKKIFIFGNTVSRKNLSHIKILYLKKLSKTSLKGVKHFISVKRKGIRKKSDMCSMCYR